MLPKIDWVVLGGLALGGIVGVFMLHSIVPVVAKPAERVVTAVVPSAYPFDSPEGWNWDMNTEKVAKEYEVEMTQSPYWGNVSNEFYNPHNVY